MVRSDRFDRNIELFGEVGQERLRRSHVAVVGVGGLGTHVVQQLSLLGVGALTLIDGEELDKSNLNRYVGVRWDDPIPGTRKVDLGSRIAAAIDPRINVTKLASSFVTQGAFDALREVECVIGCLDNDGSRLILTEFTAAYSKQYVDLASDVLLGDSLTYGGRIAVSWDGRGCPVCLGALDLEAAQRDLASPEVQRDLEAVYGVGVEHLGQSGPAVVSINGVVASLGVTEFMVASTGLRAPKRLQHFYGHRGIVTVSIDSPPPDCYYCRRIRGKRDRAHVERYLPRQEEEHKEILRH